MCICRVAISTLYSHGCSYKIWSDTDMAATLPCLVNMMWSQWQYISTCSFIICPYYHMYLCLFSCWNRTSNTRLDCFVASFSPWAFETSSIYWLFCVHLKILCYLSNGHLITIRSFICRICENHMIIWWSYIDVLTIRCWQFFDRLLIIWWISLDYLMSIWCPTNYYHQTLNDWSWSFVDCHIKILWLINNHLMMTIRRCTDDHLFIIWLSFVEYM